MVGTVFPCSAQSARKLTEPINFGEAKRIVELGGGTGAITKEILKKMKPDASLTVFETSAPFSEILKGFGDPRLTVINDSAQEIGKYVNGKIDAIISTLPLALLSRESKEKIFDAAKSLLKPSGRFVQIQYSLLSREELNEKFRIMKIGFIPLNIPPAFFYVCEA